MATTRLDEWLAEAERVIVNPADVPEGHAEEVLEALVAAVRDHLKEDA